MSRRVFAIAGALCSAACVPGCGTVDRALASIGRTVGVGTGAPLVVVSEVEGVEMSPAVRTSVFFSTDNNTADVFLSDLSADELVEALENGGVGATGNLIHINMFLMPKAGDTPVDFTAANATVRHYVFADGAVGVYSGGGFFLPTAEPTGETISARLGGVTLRLADRSGPFVDRFGTAQMRGGVRAARDETAVVAIESRLAFLIKG